jgi:hypothetical protein
MPPNYRAASFDLGISCLMSHCNTSGAVNYLSTIQSDPCDCARCGIWYNHGHQIFIHINPLLIICRIFSIPCCDIKIRHCKGMQVVMELYSNYEPCWCPFLSGLLTNSFLLLLFLFSGESSSSLPPNSERWLRPKSTWTKKNADCFNRRRRRRRQRTSRSPPRVPRLCLTWTTGKEFDKQLKLYFIRGYVLWAKRVLGLVHLGPGSTHK